MKSIKHVFILVFLVCINVASAATANSRTAQTVEETVQSEKNLHVAAVELLFDGGSYVVALEGSSGKRVAIILLNEARAARVGVSFAPYDLSKHMVASAFKPADENRLRNLLINALSKSRNAGSLKGVQEENTALLEGALRAAKRPPVINWKR